MEQKENQRVMLTKRLLKESLLHLMAEKSIQKISISELCKNAGINRVTFYHHYNTQYDLLHEMELEMANALHEALKKAHISEATPLNKRIEVICTYLQDNSEVAKLLFQNNSAESNFAIDMFRAPHVWDTVYSNLASQYGEDGRELVLTFIMHGAYSMIRQWLLSGMELTPQQMGQLVSGISIKGYWELN
ncbi:MAG: TetR/AcrR family transcriptional regulator [Peptococcaceae bacterium]